MAVAMPADEAGAGLQLLGAEEGEAEAAPAANRIRIYRGTRRAPEQIYSFFIAVSTARPVHHICRRPRDALIIPPPPNVFGSSLSRAGVVRGRAIFRASTLQDPNTLRTHTRSLGLALSLSLEVDLSHSRTHRSRTHIYTHTHIRHASDKTEEAASISAAAVPRPTTYAPCGSPLETQSRQHTRPPPPGTSPHLTSCDTARLSHRCPAVSLSGRAAGGRSSSRPRSESSARPA